MKSKKTFITLIIALLIIAVVAILVVSGNSFNFKGKWRNVGDTTFGQVQGNCILVVDDTYCNLYSPKDTYALYKDSGNYKLEISSLLFGEQLTFDIYVNSKDDIILSYGTTNLHLIRVK